MNKFVHFLRPSEKFAIFFLFSQTILLNSFLLGPSHTAEQLHKLMPTC